VQPWQATQSYALRHQPITTYLCHLPITVLITAHRSVTTPTLQLPACSVFWDKHFVHNFIASSGSAKHWSEAFSLAALGPRALVFIVAGRQALAAEQCSDQQLLDQVSGARSGGSRPCTRCRACRLPAY
jgi:hypothetical protein